MESEPGLRRLCYNSMAMKKTAHVQPGERESTDRKWSQRVTRESDALDLDEGVFTWKDPRRIALSLKRSAEESTRRKGTPLQSAMSMLNFYINRAGKTLDPAQREIPEQAKDKLRELFGR